MRATCILQAVAISLVLASALASLQPSSAPGKINTIGDIKISSPTNFRGGVHDIALAFAKKAPELRSFIAKMEASKKPVGKDSTVCFSGGGIRATIVSLSFCEALETMGSGSHWRDMAISTVSGSSWIIPLLAKPHATAKGAVAAFLDVTKEFSQQIGFQRLLKTPFLTWRNYNVEQIFTAARAYAKKGKDWPTLKDIPPHMTLSVQPPPFEVSLAVGAGADTNPKGIITKHNIVIGKDAEAFQEGVGENDGLTRKPLKIKRVILDNGEEEPLTLQTALAMSSSAYNGAPSVSRFLLTAFGGSYDRDLDDWAHPNQVDVDGDSDTTFRPVQLVWVPDGKTQEQQAKVRDPGIDQNIDYHFCFSSKGKECFLIDATSSDTDLGDLGRLFDDKNKPRGVGNWEPVKYIKCKSATPLYVIQYRRKNKHSKTKRVNVIPFNTFESVEARQKFKTSVGTDGFNYSKQLLTELYQRSLLRFLYLFTELSECHRKLFAQ